MEISKNSRQVPSSKAIINQKDYCDLLYAWLQCKSERIGVDMQGRRIAKSDINFSAIEREFTRTYEDGAVEKVMTRVTIKKYFNNLIEQGLIKYCEMDGYYYLTILDKEMANLIEYQTLMKLMNTMQRRSISIYIYLFNRYYANGFEPFLATRNQIKDYLGICTNSNNNDSVLTDTIEMLQRLGLLEVQHIFQDGKTYMQFLWVKNELPKIV